MILDDNPLTLAQNFGLSLLDLDAFDKKYLPLELITYKLIQQYRLLPLLRKGKHLFIATADPVQQSGLDEIKFHTGLTIHCIIVEQNKLIPLIEHIINTQQTAALADLTANELNELAISVEKENIKSEINISEDAPIVRYVHKILLDALHKGASDVHFEPYEDYYRIRTRLDGLLYEIARPAVNLANRITARLKIMAQIDIAERRLPQDGRFKLSPPNKRTVDFRVSTCPTVHGEKVVVRILDPENTAFTIETLGLEPSQEKLFRRAITHPHGMILVTGPTGSGKTLTLYATLNELNTDSVNISTVEDPVEIHLTGVNQVNINPKAGLSFATVLRAFLRQDPDIIMVGEIRDLETAEIAVKAAQTGHLVLSTLHTNSAPETLSRLINMGIPAYDIAASVSLIMAQRLARRLCDDCKKLIVIPEKELLCEGFLPEEINDLKIYAPAGCEKCTQGYKGRVGLFEVLLLTETLGVIIMRGGSVVEITAQARAAGMQNLRLNGLNKVKKGITSLTEINRITKD